MRLVLFDIEHAIGTLTLNHPRKRNALSNELVDELLDGFARMRAAEARVVVLRAADDAKVWSAGHDVDELPVSGRDPLGWDDALRHLVRAIEDFPCPVIAMVDGGVWGGACEVVLACDLVVAGPNATFAVTPAKLGVPYNVSGMMTFMNSANIRLVKEMVFTAQPVGAERAERMGMINHLVPAEELSSFTYGMAGVISKNSPLSIRVMKEQLRVLTGANPMTPRGFERIQGLRRIVYDSDDYREGIAAFKEKRPPSFSGS
ncbi:methylmalonyl-CoA decarboxylase [Ideonella sp. A 288]|uniref:methylmalonyl-CoA decarboxylase n=1 Tax=Ideonella sp. A 288 TaxID=1962181 RepID=UPI000B4C044E|nr:methylmalonyl-CoA decarboxylase [Ideonella sp. A 288]